MASIGNTCSLHNGCFPHGSVLFSAPKECINGFPGHEGSRQHFSHDTLQTTGLCKWKTVTKMLLEGEVLCLTGVYPAPAQTPWTFSGARGPWAHAGSSQGLGCHPRWPAGLAARTGGAARELSPRLRSGRAEELPGGPGPSPWVPSPAQRGPSRGRLRRGGGGLSAGRARGGSGEAAAPRRRRAEPGGRWRRRLGPFKATAAVTRSPPEHPAPEKGCPVPDAGKAWRRRRRRRSPRNPGPRCGVRGGKALGRWEAGAGGAGAVRPRSPAPRGCAERPLPSLSAGRPRGPRAASGGAGRADSAGLRGAASSAAAAGASAEGARCLPAACPLVCSPACLPRGRSGPVRTAGAAGDRDSEVMPGSGQRPSGAARGSPRPPSMGGFPLGGFATPDCLRGLRKLGKWYRSGHLILSTLPLLECFICRLLWCSKSRKLSGV